MEGPNDFFVPRRYKVAEGGYCIALRPSVCPTLIQYLQLWNAPSPSNPYLLCSGNQRRGTLREEPLMIWGGLGQKWLLARGKKSTQQPGINNLEEKNQPVGQEKKSSAGWSGKKTQHEFSARAPPPQIINGPSLSFMRMQFFSFCTTPTPDD